MTTGHCRHPRRASSAHRPARRRRPSLAAPRPAGRHRARSPARHRWPAAVGAAVPATRSHRARCPPAKRVDSRRAAPARSRRRPSARTACRCRRNPSASRRSTRRPQSRVNAARPRSLRRRSPSAGCTPRATSPPAAARARRAPAAGAPPAWAPAARAAASGNHRAPATTAGRCAGRSRVFEHQPRPPSATDGVGSPCGCRSGSQRRSAGDVITVLNRAISTSIVNT